MSILWHIIANTPGVFKKFIYETDVATIGGKRREHREISFKLYDIYDLDFSCFLGSKLLRVGKQPCLKKRGSKK
jgi:hypothetical protein